MNKAIEIKRALVKFGYANAQRKTKILFRGVSAGGFKALLQNKLVPSFAKYDNACKYVFIDDSTRFYLPSKDLFLRSKRPKQGLLSNIHPNYLRLESIAINK